MYELKVKDHIDSAHYIKGYIGKCSRLHGHRWAVEVVMRGESLNKLHMLADFVFVKAVIKDVLNVLDHFTLNEQLHEENVTAEFLAEWVYDRIEERMKRLDWAKGLALEDVGIWESPECEVRYSGEG